MCLKKEMNTLNIVKFIVERHSSRGDFDPVRSISKDEMDEILESARFAPTPHNMQNFEIIVVDDKKTLDQISKVKRPLSEEFVRENYPLLSFSEDELKKKKIGILGTNFPDEWRDPSKWNELFSKKSSIPLGNSIKNASALLVVLYDPSKRAPASKGDFLGILGLGCVMENIWLTANSLGIGVQIISALSDEQVEKEVKEILNIPKHLKVAFSMRLGYPLKDEKSSHVRRDTNDFVHYNMY